MIAKCLWLISGQTFPHRPYPSSEYGVSGIDFLATAIHSSTRFKRQIQIFADCSAISLIFSGSPYISKHSWTRALLGVYTGTSVHIPDTCVTCFVN